MLCPKCGDECDRDSVDVGVGVMHGPYGCNSCGWSESPEYDLTNPENLKVKDGRFKDQYGGLHSVKRVVENAERFGLGGAAKEAFKS